MATECIYNTWLFLSARQNLITETLRNRWRSYWLLNDFVHHTFQKKNLKNIVYVSLKWCCLLLNVYGLYFQKSAETKSTCSSVRSGRSRTSKPFSMCEERRLRRGIKQFGYSWKTILAQYTFSRERTAEDLRNRWRCMHRKDMKGS